MIKLDPFSSTSAQNYNLDNNSTFVGVPGYGTVTGTGIFIRAFYDQIAYNTPEFFGLKYTLALDNNNAASDFQKNKTQHIDHLITYDLKSEDFSNALSLYYGTESHMETTGTNTHEKTSLYVSDEITYQDWILSLGYGTEQYTKDVAFTRSFLGVQYLMDDWRFAFSYGNINYGNDENDAPTFKNPIDNNDIKLLGSDTQMALGGFYKLSDQISLRAVYKIYSVSRNNDSEFLDNKDESQDSNTITQIALGTTIRF